MKDQHINFLLARVEALEKELEKKTNRLNEAQSLLAELVKYMEVEYEKL